MTHRSEPSRLVVMGITGSGKTEVALGLAEALGAAFVEGDRYHPQDNLDKMSAGMPLGDADRWGWLDTLAEVCRAHLGAPGFVLSCSALRRPYRDRLRSSLPGLRFVFLNAPKDVILHRVAQRRNHFMPTSLVESQLATLESPVGEAGVIEISADQSLERVIAASLHALREAGKAE